MQGRAGCIRDRQEEKDEAMTMRKLNLKELRP
jgi:hypothetical protein